MGEALPPNIAALVQHRIQASGQDIRMVNQMRMDQPKTPPKVSGKKRARSPSEEVEDMRGRRVTHAKMRHLNRVLAPCPKVKKQMNNRFKALQVEETPVISPAKFEWTEENIPRFLGEITEYFNDTNVTSPIHKVMIALSRIAPQEEKWIDDMQYWLSGLTPDCDIPEVWDLFLTEFKKKMADREHRTIIQYSFPQNTPRMTSMDLEVYLQSFEQFLTDHPHLSDAQKKEIFCRRLTTRTMIDVSRRGPCSFTTAKYRAYHSVKQQRERWVATVEMKEARVRHQRNDSVPKTRSLHHKRCNNKMNYGSYVSKG